MKRLLCLLSLALVIFASPAVARAGLKVVATVPTLAAIARALGGSKVEVTALALPTQDPHFVDAKPSLMLPLNRADLLLTVGLQLEVGWLPTLQKGARNSDIQPGARGHLDCSQFVTLREVPLTVDRSQGDIHPGGNPHYLYDPRNVIAVARGITARLSQLDPDHGALYRKRLQRFVKRTNAVKLKLERRVASFRGTAVIGYHKSWGYLVDWLGLKMVAHVEPKPGIPPNPAQVARVLVAARKHGVRAILQESFYPSSITSLIAKKSGAALVLVPGGADFQARESYLAYLEKLVLGLEKGLRR